MLNMADLKKLDKKALEAKVVELKKQVFDLNFQKITSSVEKSHMFKVIKKDIARVKTAMTQIKTKK